MQAFVCTLVLEMAHGWHRKGPCWRVKQKSDRRQSSERQPAYSVVLKDPVRSIQTMIAWASSAGPTSTGQGSRSARPAPPASALTGCRRAGSLPPSDHGLLCARASAPVSERVTWNDAEIAVTGHLDRRRVSKASQRQRIAKNDKLRRTLARFAARLKLQVFRPAASCGFYPALSGWPLSQHPSATWRRVRSFCGSAKLATVAPWLPLTNRSRGVRRSARHLAISTTMRVRPRVPVDDERSALR